MTCSQCTNVPRHTCCTLQSSEQMVFLELSYEIYIPGLYMFIGQQKKHPTRQAGPSTEHLHMANIANKETEQAASRSMAT